MKLMSPLDLRNEMTLILLFFADFMAPAVASLEAVLADVEFSKPRIPVISNVDAKRKAPL
jgi:malonyl CoA-acyl carrier protein transacylase